jgi:hypothetical protein
MSFLDGQGEDGREEVDNSLLSLISIEGFSLGGFLFLGSLGAFIILNLVAYSL